MRHRNGLTGRFRHRLRRRAHRITQRLRDTYGLPHHNNKDDPVDELVFILLSLMTTGPSFNRVFDRLKAACPSWSDVLDMPLPALEALIKDAGLSHQKGPRIQSILQRLKRDFGTITLDPLRSMSDQDAEAYLIALPGVGKKAAKCVLMYSFGRDVLPVDTHVWRVARRLGLVASDTPYSRVHEEIENAVGPGDRHAFHVTAISHGRTLCLPFRPICSSCPLRRMCPYPRRATDAAGTGATSNNALEHDAAPSA